MSDPWSRSSNAKPFVSKIGMARAPVAACGLAPAWIERVANACGLTVMADGEIRARWADGMDRFLFKTNRSVFKTNRLAAIHPTRRGTGLRSPFWLQGRVSRAKLSFIAVGVSVAKVP